MHFNEIILKSNSNCMDIGTVIDYTNESIKRKQFNILIVDDDTDVAHLLKDYLELRGHTVSTVDEGARGIYCIINNRYDIVFLDYHLKADGSPDCFGKLLDTKMDGALVTECIKEKIDKSELIFAYTGDTSDTAINEFKNVGMDGVIFKPIEILMLNRLMNLLETSDYANRLLIRKVIKQYKKSILVF